MMTKGQLWVTRRLGDIITELEIAAGQIDPQYYPNAESFMTDVFDETLSKTFDGDVTEFDSDSFNDKYSSVLSALEDIFGEQLRDFYQKEMSGPINESFDQILDLFDKKRSGQGLKPSEQTMMRFFNDFVKKGGKAEEFVYNEEMDYDYDDREGQTFEYNGFDMPLIYTFSEEYEQDGEINYFGEIKFEDDEFLGVISTDQRGYLTGYDFYSVLEDDVRLQDILKDMQIEDEVTNFFAEEVIPILKK